MSEGKRVGCKYCDWSVPLWTMSGGKKTNGFTRLHRHMKDCHSNEYHALMKKLNREEDSKVREAVQMAEGEEP